MVNKIDTENLAKHINELTILKREYSACRYVPNSGECGGESIEQMRAMTTALQQMQNAFVLLLGNTISYMQQRKDSVDTKENAAATEVKK